MSRAEAASLARTTLTTLTQAPQGEARDGVAGAHGWFYHFLNMKKADRAGLCELSTIDTALLAAGALFVARYFDGPSADETAVRDLGRGLYEGVDWSWMKDGEGRFHLHWKPEDGFSRWHWQGYNESMILLILALGAADGRTTPRDYWTWSLGYPKSWRWSPAPHLGFGPMFGHQYSHVWIDYRGILDAFMRERGFDYFENSRRAVLAQHAYARANPGKWSGYGEALWGLTACDGPGDFSQGSIFGGIRKFRAYSARGEGDFDDGTLAPTAVAASLPFAPELVTPTLQRMISQFGEDLYRPQGFQDAFNPTVTGGAPPQYGEIRPRTGWVSKDMLGIDQGPIVLMIENHRTGMIWNLMRQEPVIRRGLQRAGFTGGWLA